MDNGKRMLRLINRAHIFQSLYSRQWKQCGGSIKEHNVSMLWHAGNMQQHARLWITVLIILCPTSTHTGQDRSCNCKADNTLCLFRFWFNNFHSIPRHSTHTRNLITCDLVYPLNQDLIFIKKNTQNSDTCLLRYKGFIIRTSSSRLSS